MESQNWYDFNNLSGQPNIGDQLRAGRNQLLKIGGTALGNFTEATEALDQKYMPWRKDLLDKGSEAWGNAVTNLTNNERVGRIAETTSRISGEIFAPDALESMLTIGAATVGVMAPEPVTSIAGAAILANKGRKIITRGSKYMDEFRRAFAGNTSGFSNPIYDAKLAVVGGGDLNRISDVSPITKLESTGNVSKTSKKTKVFKEPSRTAIKRADEMMDEGWALPEALLQNYENLKADDLTHLYKNAKKVYNDYDEYREAIAKYGQSKGIVENVGVLKIGGDIKLGKKRGGPISIRGTVEDINTKLNRQLSELPQTKGGKVTFNQDSKIIKTLKKHYNVSQIDKHHGEALNQLEFLYRDASAADQKALTNFIVDELKRPIGSTIENRMNIPKTEVHDPFHKLLREEAIGLEKTKDPTNIMPDLLRVANKQQAMKGLPPFKNLKHLTLEQRKGAAKVWFEHISPHNHEVLFDLMQKMNKKRLSK